MDIKSKIPVFPNWPKPGVNFLDVTGILNDSETFNFCIKQLSEYARAHQATSIVAIESRGFIFGSPVAFLLGIPLIVVRKPNKLPGEIITNVYETEYSTDSLSVKTNSDFGSNPFIIDDLIATGGTMIATTDLIKNSFPLSTNIGAGVVINLSFLPGEHNLSNQGIKLNYLVNYNE